MTQDKQPEIEFEHEDFDFVTIEEEVRVDERCRELLNRFYLNLVAEEMTPQHASELAFSADLFVRDYLLDFARQNVVRPQPGIVRRFAGNWFIIHTLDPEMRVLERHLEAIREFYRFLHGQHFISSEELAIVEDEAGQTDYYRQRIESFNDISGDGYMVWEAECPAKG